MYAKVKFLQDGKISIVQNAVVKNFRPANVADFERTTTYKVFWDGDENTRGGYYDAEIIRLAVGAGWSVGGRSTVLGAPPALRWSLGRARLASGTFDIRATLEEEEEKEENPEVLRLKAKLDKRAGKIRRLKAENEGLRKLNQELQLALCTKVLEKDSLAKEEHIALLESRRREQNQRCKRRRRANATDDDRATEAKRKREALRRLHSTPAKQFPGATVMFRREF
ncbi:hypothetical protein HPB47_018373 [Ixodes persulcatus]|uniref:Uncharacterized protein n=1 Tax=Ixodes persulcatus TaxID=34615 RepID=A0AC60QKX9_IXOPE|nr:hypothetical protein HPB47_018373 [Ixodes persulcatus]